MALKFLPKEVAKKYHNADLVDRAYEEGTSLFLPKVPLENVEEIAEYKTNSAQAQLVETKARSSQIHSNVPRSLAGGQATQAMTAVSTATSIASADMQADLALKLNNEDAPMCSFCGRITVRNGACYKCIACGETSGCS